MAFRVLSNRSDDRSRCSSAGSSANRLDRGAPRDGYLEENAGSGSEDEIKEVTASLSNARRSNASGAPLQPALDGGAGLVQLCADADSPCGPAEEAYAKDDCDHEGAMLPRQLSPALLAVLLEDLIEFNGIAYRPVPLRTFRDKYIGLYFATWRNDKCCAFWEKLKNFYLDENHRFECVLVSCDNNDADYDAHTQLTSWPTYPRGDFRPALLRNHFQINNFPTLVILDANGLVVDGDGVSKVEQWPFSAPWSDGALASSSVPEAAGQCLQVISGLGLPEFNGVTFDGFDVIGLIFGEPWCPDTQEILVRATYLLERLLPQCERNDYCMFYFLHSEPLHKFSAFLNVNIPFPCLQLENETLATALHQMTAASAPCFCVSSTRDVWLVQDGADWLRRDPAGVCFPWKPWARFDGPLSSYDAPFHDCVRELRSDELSTALCQGPVFIGLLHNVHAGRSEMLAQLRAAATAYRIRVGQRERDRSREPIRLAAPLTQHSLDHESIDWGRLETSASTPARGLPAPGSSDASKITSCRMLYSAVQDALAKQQQLEAPVRGAAPWNYPGAADWLARREALSFYYCSMKDHAVSILKAFCTTDSTRLLSHDAWLHKLTKRDTDVRKQVKDLELRLQQLWREHAESSQGSMTGSLTGSIAGSISGSIMPSSKRRASVANAVRRRSLLPDPDPPMGETSPTQGLGSDANQDFVPTESQSPRLLAVEANGAKDQPANPGSSHQPRIGHTPLNKLTEELVGHGVKPASGVGLIVDLACGAYYVCGNLMDRDTIIRFLDGWYEDEVQPFDICLFNDVEREAEDEEQYLATHLNDMSNLGVAFAPHPPTDLIPTIVLWVPTLAHSRCGMSPAAMYRAILNHANRTCPRTNKEATTWLKVQDLDGYDLLPHDDEGSGALTPWVQKFLIFGLQRGPDEVAEMMTDAGAWNAPMPEYLDSIRDLVGKLLQVAPGETDKQSRPTTKLHTTSAPRFAESAIQKLRAGTACIGEGNLAFYEAATRRELQHALLDELTYFMVVECPPPPMHVLLIGDLPPPGDSFWPQGLRAASVHVIGQVRELARFRQLIAPSLTVTSWETWMLDRASDKIAPAVARRIGVSFPTYA